MRRERPKVLLRGDEWRWVAPKMDAVAQVTPWAQGLPCALRQIRRLRLRRLFSAHLVSPATGGVLLTLLTAGHHSRGKVCRSIKPCRSRSINTAPTMLSVSSPTTIM